MTQLSALLTSERPDHGLVAVASEGARDWAQFKWHVAALAADIEQSGGERWLVATENAYALAVGLFAVLHAGGTVYLPANLQAGHLDWLSDGVDGAVSDGPLQSSDKDVLPPLEREAGAAPLSLEPLSGLSAGVVLHTSGTTEAPKSISKPLRCLDAEVQMLERAFGPLSNDPVLATVPPYHIYGLLFRVLWPLAASRPFTEEPIRFPGELSAALREGSKPTLVSSPAFLTRALAALDLALVGGRLGRVFSSGGPLPAETAALYSAHLDHPVVEVYGSTETGGIGYRSVRDADVVVPWTALPGVSVSVSESTGLLAVKSPFLDNAEWYTTADRAVLQADSRFVLEGRADRVVKLEERRISLIEVEARLAGCREVEAVRALAMKGAEGRRSILAAVVVPSGFGWNELAKIGKRAMTERLRERLRPFIDSMALPRKWRFVRRMPETAQGKTTNADLAALFESTIDGKLWPKVLQRSLDGADLHLRLELEPDITFFSGHFDAAAVLAGVVQLDWAIRYAQEAFEIPGHPHSVEALKFFHILPAGSVATLKLHYDRHKERLTFSYLCGDQQHSSGRIRFPTDS